LAPAGRLWRPTARVAAAAVAGLLVTVSAAANPLDGRLGGAAPANRGTLPGGHPVPFVGPVVIGAGPKQPRDTTDSLSWQAPDRGDSQDVPSVARPAGADPLADRPDDPFANPFDDPVPRTRAARAARPSARVIQPASFDQKAGAASSPPALLAQVAPPTLPLPEGPILDPPDVPVRPDETEAVEGMIDDLEAGAPPTDDPPAAPRMLPDNDLTPFRRQSPRPTDRDTEARPPCNRIYHDRDCCAVEAECRSAWQKLADSPLSRISVDITPSIQPEAVDAAELAEARRQRLDPADERVWTNRAGEVVARGKLHDFVQGSVYVADESGVTSRVPYRELSDDDLCYLTAWWGLPTECRLGDQPLELRNWTLLTFTWKASSLCHKPLYFEDVELERYGHAAGPWVQPLLSGAHFFGDVLLLPYNTSLNPPLECQYALGYYRPGDCAPWMVPAFPLSLRAAKRQAATILALSALIP